MSVEYLEEWINKAEEDYETAVALIRKRKNPTPNTACYHCQQSTEKYLKSFLVKNQIKPPKTHDLLELHKLCLLEDSSLAFIVNLLHSLNPYATEYRYPGEGATVEQAREAVKHMKKVRRFIRSKLGLR